MKHFVLFILLISALVSHASDSTEVRHNGNKFFDLKDKFYTKRVYVYWGYNRESYSRSDIRIYGKGFDFTLRDVAAHDKPSPFNAKVYITSLTIPQYNYRIGSFITHNLHVSFGLDHMKYVATHGQTVDMTGYIDPSVSQKYSGVYNHKMMTLTDDFLQLQHTNGLNSLTLDIGWLLPIFHTRDDIFHFGWNFGTGGVFMVTRTQVHFMGVYYPNNFHLSGVTWPVYTGPRIDLWKCFFFAAELKGGYVYIPWAPFEGTDHSGVQHHFTYVEYYLVFGLSFPLSKSEYPFIKRKKKHPLSN